MLIIEIVLKRCASFLYQFAKNADKVCGVAGDVRVGVRVGMGVGMYVRVFVRVRLRVVWVYVCV